MVSVYRMHIVFDTVLVTSKGYIKEPSGTISSSRKQIIADFGN